MEKKGPCMHRPSKSVGRFCSSVVLYHSFARFAIAGKTKNSPRQSEEADCLGPFPNVPKENWNELFLQIVYSFACLQSRGVNAMPKKKRRTDGRMEIKRKMPDGKVRHFLGRHRPSRACAVDGQVGDLEH